MKTTKAPFLDVNAVHETNYLPLQTSKFYLFRPPKKIMTVDFSINTHKNGTISSRILTNGPTGNEAVGERSAPTTQYGTFVP